MISKLNVEDKSSSYVWEGKKLEFKSGLLAPSCDGSVVIQLGDTSLLVTCMMNNQPNPDSDFLPLAVDFKETFYAGGKIGGAAYTRREGRPSDFAVLTSRLTDRPLRPMFPAGMINDVILTITALSADRENNAGIPSIIGSSLAIMLAGIPFDGPVSAVRIGYKDGNYLVNPNYDEVEQGMIDIVIAGTKDSVTMIECGAKQVSDEILFGAIQLAQTQLAQICAWQEEFVSKFEITKKEIKFNKPSEKLLDYIRSTIPAQNFESIYPANKDQYRKVYDDSQNLILESAKTLIEDSENEEFTVSKVKMGVYKVFKEYIRGKILNEEKRVDGRNINQVRPLYTQVGLIPRVHGSGLFQRGETQVLGITTLGAPGDVQLIDTMEHDQIEKRFMHHYNMPPFSTGEAKLGRAPGRRELGHGALAEKAIKYVLPPEEIFPYTIRSVSEVLSSNGSTSMASVCATTLALMDAGVPIQAPVSGIAMGLVMGENGNYKILTDIQGLEDFVGDMDFKVAGTSAGITALQMDIKIKGLSFEILKSAIERANIGRIDILNFMLQTLEKPREQLNPYAPKITTKKMNQQQVREVIGPGGSVITEIIKQTGVKIDFKEDGTCIVTAKDGASSDAAWKLINEIIWVPSVNDVIDGVVTRVETYGAFVSIGKNKMGLCHVKNLGGGYIADAKMVVKEGDKMRVKIIGIDDDGKVQLKKEI